MEKTLLADFREILRQELAPLRAGLNSLSLIGEAIAVLQRDVRLLRAAVNDMGRTNITAGEVESMHTDIDQVLATISELAARVKVLEGKLT